MSCTLFAMTVANVYVCAMRVLCVMQFHHGWKTHNSCLLDEYVCLCMRACAMCMLYIEIVARRDNSFQFCTTLQQQRRVAAAAVAEVAAVA